MNLTDEMRDQDRKNTGTGIMSDSQENMQNMTKIIMFLSAVLFLLPAASSPDDVNVLKEHSKSVVVVAAYNNKGRPLTEGTGFIASPAGAVVTNYHVIGIAKDIKVKAGKANLAVEGIIHADKENDLVVLKVKGKAFPAISTGELNKMKVGERVYILSSSEETGTEMHEGTFVGIKTTAGGRKVLKITAPVLHGSSGSPVFNGNGEVIGIVTFLIKRTQNILLAMPADLIKERVRSKKVVLSKNAAIQAYKKTPQYRFYLGYFLLEAGAHAEAIDVLKEAVKLKRSFADAYYYLGAAYEKSGKDPEAASAYRKAVLAEPDFTDAYFSIGLTYGRMRKYREAIDALKSAVRLEPDYADAHYNLGLAYLLFKDKNSTLKEYRVLKDLSPGLANKLFRLM